MTPGAWAAFKLRVMLFLFRAYTFQCTLTPASRQSRRVSPRPGVSTFTTSAPKSASWRLSMLPATRREKSSTRTPSSGPVRPASNSSLGSAIAPSSRARADPPPRSGQDTRGRPRAPAHRCRAPPGRARRAAHRRRRLCRSADRAALREGAGGGGHRAEGEAGLLAERGEVVVQRLADHLAVAQLDDRHERQVHRAARRRLAEPRAGDGAAEAPPVHEAIALDDLALDEGLAVRHRLERRRGLGGHRLPTGEAKAERHVDVVRVLDVGGGGGSGIVPRLRGQVLLDDSADFLRAHV